MPKKNKLKIIPLGGLDEIGKNMTAIEYGNDMIIIDCGMAFPDEELLGIDVVIPDFTYVIKNQERLKGIILTHGHEDHIGAIPYLLKLFNLPIYLAGNVNHTINPPPDACEAFIRHPRRPANSS